MRHLTLNVASTTLPALILGILSQEGADERRGVPMGDNTPKARKSFNVLVVDGDDAPEMKDEMIVDGYPRLAASSPGSSELALWIERTPITKRNQNASLVKVVGVEDYTVIEGFPQIKAGGQKTVLVQVDENSAIVFLAENGQQFVLFTEDNAREPQVATLEAFLPKLRAMTGATTATARPQIGTHDRASTGATSR